MSPAAVGSNYHHRHMEGFANHGGMGLAYVRGAGMGEHGEREGGGGVTGVALEYGDILPPAGGHHLQEGHRGQGHGGGEPDGADGVAQTTGGVGAGGGSELGMMRGADGGEVTASAITSATLLSIQQEAVGESCLSRGYGCGDTTCCAELSRGRCEIQGGGGSAGGREHLAGGGGGAGGDTLLGCQGQQIEPLESQLAGQKRPRLDLSEVHGEHASLGREGWKEVGVGGLSGVVAPCGQSPSFMYGIGGGHCHDTAVVERDRRVDEGVPHSSPA